MSLFGVSITYAVCWWLVLFMVLPWGVQMAKNPEAGHARSAPVRPMIRRKILITSLLTVIPTFLLYCVISDAQAADGKGVYSTKHAGEGCRPATLPNSSASVPVNINVPISPYFDASKQGSNAAAAGAVASQGSIGLGQGEVGADGSLTLNGKKLGAANTTGDCPPEPTDDGPPSTKSGDFN